MVISETWFAESSSADISGYNVYRRDRASHSGGICIYVRCDLDSHEISDVVLTDSAVDQVWFGIKICNERIFIGCIYIPDPNAVNNVTTFNSLTRVYRLVSKGTYTGVMLTGDFNHSSKSWDELGFPTTFKKSVNSFYRKCQELYLVPTCWLSNLSNDYV